MQEGNAVEVRDVHKIFKVYLDKGKMLKEKVLFAKRNRYEERHVLNGISYDIPRGQAVGLIGRNGCGKSTNLKLLTRILKPNSGTIEVAGRVSSLIELGAGFHPDMSGRENIYINATIFGLSNDEIDRRIEDIIEFSELREFIDNPVRTYSSGMYMRLAFAVAINVDADVLLIDEILAVGDVSFQKKCFDKLVEVKENGTTIVIVSHSMDQMLSICDRLIWIENGKLKEDGEPKVVSMHYLDSMEDERIAKLAKESQEKLRSDRERSILELTDMVHPEARRDGTGDVVFTSIDMYDANGEKCHIYNTGDKAVLKIEYKTELEHPSVNFNMDFVRSDNWQYCYGSCFTKPGDELPILNKKGTIYFTIEKLNLLPGKYYLDVGINGEGGELYDNVRNVLQIQIRDYIHNEFGICSFDHSWKAE